MEIKSNVQKYWHLLCIIKFEDGYFYYDRENVDIRLVIRVCVVLVKEYMLAKFPFRVIVEYPPASSLNKQSASGQFCWEAYRVSTFIQFIPTQTELAHVHA